MDEEKLLRIKKFLGAVPEDMERDKKYHWTCPLCGGTVAGIRLNPNGHLHAGCSGCGIKMAE